MNYLKTFLFMILCALFLSACGKAENTSTSNSSKKEESIETKKKLNVKITLDKEITNNKIIILSGKSNLPKDTKLRIRLEQKNSHKNSIVNTAVQKDGSFEYKFFNEGDTVFDDGKYIIYVETLPVLEQTEVVQELFGDNGSNLSGSQISGDSELKATAEINLKINNSEVISEEETLPKDTDAEEEKNEDYTSEEVEDNSEEDELDMVKDDAKIEIKTIIEENYKTTSIEKIEINEDMGSNENNKLIALVYLSFDALNTSKTAYNMVEMYKLQTLAKIMIQSIK
ncbi:hypothetical protein [Bacillus safensis]|uniref:hypothetical protein n=1 Tax=Bacillus safensis TaxID=561879 RepID=UPI00227E0431|nr:hypothetical protein [Bacillus safensis]MCY7507547.1 hypothetical protein [Bacillus safensis]MCY7516622.1 hypothetical protein [Bacillus safensis]MED4706144.1 hypothetical protein [Bacillus safensis]